MMRSFWLALIFCLAVSAVAEERAVQLLLPSRRLEPTSTFELRFVTEMVAADQVGKPEKISPLVFVPQLEGQFVWLSTRSGTFAPKGILPLGTKYQISLRAGLKDAAGRAVTAAIKETAETPPMRVKGVSPLGGADPQDAPAVPRFLILFNANVKAEACAKFIRFTNASGAKIDARVEQAGDPKNRDHSFSVYQSDDHSLAVWAEKAPPVTSETSELEDEAEDKSKPTAPRQNILFVAPAKPLSPGNGWKLVIDPGLPASEWKTSLPARKEIEIGTVKPFAVSSIAAESNRIAGRRVIVLFTKELAKEVTAETVSRWISITPVPENFKVAVDTNSVTLKGSFALGTKYRVTLKPGLEALQPFKIERAET